MKILFKQIVAFLIFVCATSFAFAQTTGILRVKTDVSEVRVILDDKEVGRTPLTLKDITIGKHKLILLKEGYEDHSQEIEVTQQKTSSVFVVMKPTNIEMPDLPVTFKIIHQHRLGYCTGELTVTSDALDFKAVDDADKFHIPITDIKSVARSWGPVVGDIVSGINAPTDLMAMRIETSGRSYGFLAFKDTVNDKMEIASVKTKEMYEIVYRLWSATLKPKAEKK